MLLVPLFLRETNIAILILMLNVIIELLTVLLEKRVEDDG